jgi:ribosomal-protein-serine acetyltransferase
MNLLLNSEISMLTVDENIQLTPLNAPMAESLCELVNDNRAYLSHWLPWVPNSQKAEHFLAFINQTIAEREEQKSLVLGIFWQQQLVGVCGFNKIDWQLGVADLGYWLAADMQGKGIMTKSCHWLINYAFEELKINKVQLSAAVENKASRQVAKRLGMTLEGVLRRREKVGDKVLDHAVYGLLREEWKL